MPPARWRTALMIPVVLASCRDLTGPLGAGGVDVTVEPASVAGGEVLDVTLVNTADRVYTYNLCSDRLEYQVNGGWQPAPQSLRLCTEQAFILPAHGSSRGVYGVDLGLAPGTYRLRVTLRGPGGDSVEPRSNSFQITGDPQAG